MTNNTILQYSSDNTAPDGGAVLDCVGPFGSAPSLSPVSPQVSGVEGLELTGFLKRSSGDQIVSDSNGPTTVLGSPMQKDSRNTTQEYQASDINGPLDVNHDALAFLTPLASPFNNLLLDLDSQSPEVVQSSRRYFNVAGNTYGCSAGGTIWLHVSLTPSPFTAVPLEPVQRGSMFFIGLLAHYVDELGRLYSLCDNARLLEPKRVFDSDIAAWQDLVAPGDSGQLTGSSDLLDSAASLAALEAGINNEGLTWVSSLLSASPPPIPLLPLLAPALSEPGGSETSSESNMYHHYPSLFSSDLSDATATLTTPDSALSTPSISLDEEELKIKSEIDAYVAKLRAQRKHRGHGRSLVKLKCPWCDRRPERRPLDLREH
ncbi:hypothetical protein FRC07_002316, partial [Ceratobasidium sp. 392]